LVGLKVQSDANNEMKSRVSYFSSLNSGRHLDDGEQLSQILSFNILITNKFESFENRGRNVIF